MSDLDQFEIRDQPTIRDAILRTIRNGLIELGVSNPNVGPGSDWFILATAVGNELAVVEANAVIKADELMPDTTSGDGLVRWLAAVNVVGKRSAEGSLGLFTLSSTASSPVSTGALLIDSAGLTYSVDTGSTYANGATINVSAVSTGVQTNHANGDILTWVAAPPFANPTVTVGIVGGTDGLTGGVDEESEEAAKARLLSHLQNPPSAGNAQHVAELAEAASPRVQKCFVYPAAQGPATVHFAVAGYPTAHLAATQAITAPTTSRLVNTTIITTLITPYVRGILPEHVYVFGTECVDQPTDVSIGMTLPNAPTSSPSGPGGGWIDGTPWPYISGTASTKVTVTARTSDTVFTLDAPTAPIDGAAHVAYLNRTDWKIYKANVLSHTGTAGAYVVTLDSPLVGIAVGDYVFPQSVAMQSYVTAVLKAFAAMGPGEKSSNPDVLERGFRHPTPQQSWPSSLGAQQLKALSDVGDEVLDVAWYYRSSTTPTIPVSLAVSGPSILIARRIGLYAI